MTEEEMRQALFGNSGATGPTAVPHAVLHRADNQPLKASAKRATGKNFVPKLIVTLRVGNEFEGQTELFTHLADTLSTLQAELDALKEARKKYKYIELVSVEPAK
ncbi:hypothetical protein [Pseudomonas syringae]|uniref:Uncharacterized protein n=1 Tax=Pseudomonas syringae pv. actinidiae TaxID=103796 RepID=A0A2P0QHF4_PSESF|nr:hypothetical protein [Pseudomonas syringae]APQ06970.1 hypothetical protein PsaNZ47_29965 [Pseudomonas syringae pv. actinidiae]ARO44950.1 hypothetical protein [Pseudomonas syringae pv. actinidiae]ARO45053.1 hypothetical protein [Pseudomonas syringae pv. actinidiae]ARO45146.1 hypothetical protein [Pseudomonas syringae pv. actinidiae]MDU8389128.1 hypothetical protein [Pseudomonas syringae pv. actinidiae]